MLSEFVSEKIIVPRPKGQSPPAWEVRTRCESKMHIYIYTRKAGSASSTLIKELRELAANTDDDKARKKLLFTAKACEQLPECRYDRSNLEQEMNDIVAWIARSSEEEIIAWREKEIARIEKCAREHIASGRARNWLHFADSETRRISAKVNGPLAEQLAAELTYTDGECVMLCRDGGPVIGRLPCSGAGTPYVYDAPKAVQKLWEECGQSNKKLLARLREDGHADVLYKQTVEDAALGRMTEPCRAAEVDIDECVIALRLSREQGLKADGAIKLRAVDDETTAGVNPCCQPTEKLHCDAMDDFVCLILALCEDTGLSPDLWKADIDSAYRRIPVSPEQRDLLWVTFMKDGEAFASRHNAMPFGSVASVHAWNRIGAFLAQCARSLLRIPVFRYVDDYFSADRPKCAEHAMTCFARLVRAILGEDAISERKLQVGNPLDVLGLSVEVKDRTVSMHVMAEIPEHWACVLEEALANGRHPAGDAAKMAGRLNFATQQTFRRLGRAMVRPFYCQQYSPLAGGRIGPMLRLSMRWWSHVLRLCICERVRLDSKEEPLKIFCDARGYPPRIAAVFVHGNDVWYTDWVPPSSLIDPLMPRKDNQIMTQEILAIVIALHTFLPYLKSRRVIVYTDNAGGEGALRKGTTEAWDHNLLVHGVWLLAAKARIGLWVERVPTDDNISDDPSREAYALLESIGANWCEPVVPPHLWEPEQWDSVVV